MPAALALTAVASLVAAAAVDVDVGMSTEGRSTAVTATGPGLRDDSRNSLIAVPSATGILDASRLRFSAAYAPRLWTSDLGASMPFLVNHVAELRVATRHELAWRWDAAAMATRGTVDPLADPLRAAALAGEPAQLAMTRPARFEELVAAGRGELPLGPRTTLHAGGSWLFSRALEAEDRVIVPLQRRASAEAALVRLVTERDTLRLEAAASRTGTVAPWGAGTGAVATGAAIWRRALTPQLDGWAGGGASLAWYEFHRSSETAVAGASGLAGVAEGGSRDVLPRAEVGVGRGAPGLAVTGELVARLTTLVDRYTGEVRPVADARGTLRWRARERWAVAASAFGAARTDGETTLGGGEARLSWSVRERLVLELGMATRFQRERRPELPDFVEVTAFAVVAYASERLLRAAVP